MDKGLHPVGAVTPADLTQVVHFGHKVPHLAPPTPAAVVPDIAFLREFAEGKLTVGGRRLTFWTLKDPARPEDSFPLPSPTIRVRQGQIVHVTLTARTGPHTIHHHGIEPSTFNDGVGHTSFEVNPRYTYQWRAHQAGTYLYHCHVNTVLHFQMGMFGFLVVDPPTGPGQVFADGPTYQAEALWAPYDIDPAFHELPHNAALGAPDPHVHLNRYRPELFTVNGVTAADARRSPKTVVQARVGQTVLLRHLTAAYFPVSTSFGALEATVVGSDGRPVPRPYAVTSLPSTSGERYDVLLRASRPGIYPVRFQFRHWLRGHVVGSAVSYVIVT
jgi:FtsP/CotA-like multicopper oxidase with cupredoxin domain